MVQYGIWGEVFADIALRFRFLLKKEAREDMFYLFKLRPSYRLHPQYDVSNLQREFNQDNTVQNGDRIESLSNFGFRLSFVIPFLNEAEKFYYKKGGTLDQERLKKKMKQME